MDSGRCGTDEGGDVGRHAPGLQKFQILPKGGPTGFYSPPILGKVLFHGGAEGPHRITFPKHLEGDALGDITDAASILNQTGHTPTNHVDKTRTDGFASGIYYDIGGGLPQVTQGVDSITPDAQVGGVGRIAGAVIDRAAQDQRVVMLLLLGATCGQGHQQQRASQGVDDGFYAGHDARSYGTFLHKVAPIG